MGYRSDVAIAIPKKVYEENMKMALASPKEERSKYDLLLNPDILINNKDSYFTVLVFYDIKWYNFSEDFVDVKFIENIIKNLDKSEPYAFVRCGEDLTDFEEDFYEGTVDTGDESVYDLFHLMHECQIVLDVHKKDE